MNTKDWNRRCALTAIATAAVALFGATLGGCGGTDLTEAESEELAEALKTPVTISDQGPNAVSAWNEITYNTFSLPADPAGATAEERAPTAIDIATVQLAVYDAVIAIAGTHRPFAVRAATSGAGGGPVAMEAAAVEAAYRMLKGLYPSRGAQYEAPYANAVAALPATASSTLGRTIGAEVAAAMLALRANDGRATVLPPYVPGTLPGQFRGINPVNRIGPYIKPLATLSHSQFRAPGPRALGTAEYAADVNEVQMIASATSAVRTAEQTTVARFHTEPPNAYWARNLRRFATASTGLANNARALAMVWTAYTDAISGTFESKYHHNFWRPTSAIQLADTDGNAATTADPAWTPVVPTPNHPEYPAAHSTGAGAVAETVRTFYGTKKVTFEFNSLASGTTLQFNSTDDLVKSNIHGRVWGGMHYRTSGEHGAELGKNVAKWIAKNHFQPVP